MDETFLLSNISPQFGVGFNRGVWRKIEQFTRDLLKAGSEIKSLHVITGSLFLPTETDEDGRRFVRYEVIGEGNVAVPTHFFKVILAERADGDFEENAFIVPNKKIREKDISKFNSTRQKVEEVSGLIFFKDIKKHSSM